MDFWWILYVIDGFLFFFTAITVLYLLVFSIASLFSRHDDIAKAKRQRRFIILIPSYKEDQVVVQSLATVLGQTYPQRQFDVVVISDHQSEMTNMRLAQYPITLLTPNFVESNKAKSLQYAILNLPEFKIFDCVVVLNADNVVEPEFLEQVNDAFEAAGTKVIQLHRVSKNRDTEIARLDSVFEEINNSIFRKGHIAMGLSASLNSSGIVYDFNWFKEHIMDVRSMGEDKELEALLMREHIYIDYFSQIRVYNQKKRNIKDFNNQRGRWAASQLHSLVSNIGHLPSAILNRHYDQADKILQWMLIPRTILMGIILIMSALLPFIYFSLVIKWWMTAAVVMLAFSLATPDYLVDKHWDKDFLKAPFVMLGGLFNIAFVGQTELHERFGIRKIRKAYRSIVKRFKK